MKEKLSSWDHGWHVIAGYLAARALYIVGFSDSGHEVYYIEEQSRYPQSRHPYTDGGLFLRRETLGSWRASSASRDAGVFARISSRTRHTLACRRTKSSSSTVKPTRSHDGGSHEFNDDAGEGRVIYVESDPGLEQIKVDKDESVTIDYLRKHRALFTFGENIGTNAFPVPLHGFTWKPTRQPVVTDFWRTDSPVRRSAIFTSVANWR